MSQLQKPQAIQQQQSKEIDVRRPSMKTLPVPSGSGSGSGGGGVSPGGGRRSSSIPSLQGPRKASMSSGGSHGITAGPSLMGLLASKRLAKKFASRFHNRRYGRLSAAGMHVQKEPTYRMEPHRKFNHSQVEQMMQTLLEDKLSKFRYSPKICANMCKILADDIKDKVKLMNFDRYKVVVDVVIGQKKDQALVISARCSWDDSLDDFATYTFQNEHIYCTATTYGLYAE